MSDVGPKMEEWHRSHPHPLKENNSEKIYTCDGCFQPGIKSSHRCVKGCDYKLHSHCMHYKSETKHHLFPNSTFEFRFQPNDTNTHCSACGAKVKGFGYHSWRKGRYDLHPYCMNLPYELKFDDVVLTLRGQELDTCCLWCDKKKVKGSVGGVRGWCYVSECGEYCYHVHCANEMVLKGSEKIAYGGLELALPPNMNMNMRERERALPLQKRVKTGVAKLIKIGMMFLKYLVRILIGDPTTIFTLPIDIANFFNDDEP